MNAEEYLLYFYSFDPLVFFLRLNILLLNRMIFITAKNKIKIIKVRIGFVGASTARNIIGNPNTIAGKF